MLFATASLDTVMLGMGSLSSHSVFSRLGCVCQDSWTVCSRATAGDELQWWPFLNFASKRKPNGGSPWRKWGSKEMSRHFSWMPSRPRGKAPWGRAAAGPGAGPAVSTALRPARRPSRLRRGARSSSRSFLPPLSAQILMVLLALDSVTSAKRLRG